MTDADLALIWEKMDDWSDEELVDAIRLARFDELASEPSRNAWFAALHPQRTDLFADPAPFNPRTKLGDLFCVVLADKPLHDSETSAGAFCCKPLVGSA